MKFTTETARTEACTAARLASETFKDLLNCSTDSIFKDASRKTVYCFTGLAYYAPVMSHIMSVPALRSLLLSRSGSVLLRRNGNDIILHDGTDTVLEAEYSSLIIEILDRTFSSAGTLNEQGELVLDLKGYNIGPHYPVNLLLGDRSAYADCLQSTPKSVLDAFGRGSFRGAQERQVLATRYELSLEVNGEPVNRQFYLVEDGKQIFYSLNVSENVRSAVCVHSRNRTVITYETECGLTITRTIFILPQEDNMPPAVEAQHITIENHSGRTRELSLVATGMFGITDPGTLTSDIVFANLVVESELYEKDGRIIALAAHHKPVKCNREKRFAMLLSNGAPMDSYASNYYDFIGSGTPDHPEGVSQLNNMLNFKQASFFALGKNLIIPDHSTVPVDVFVGMSENESDVREQFDSELDTMFNRYQDPEALEKTLNDMIQAGTDYSRFLQMNTGNSAFDSYVTTNLPFQVLYQTYVSRSFAWTQKSYRETGFREIQDIYASMYYMHAQKQDSLVKKLIASWIVNVFEMGYSYHNFTSRGKEPGMCSDDSLWLAQAVYRYVKLSGDSDFLKQEFKVAGSTKTRRLIDTLYSTIVYSGKISVGAHKLPLLDIADWNDTLRLDKTVYLGPEKENLYYEQLKRNNQQYGVPFENHQTESVMNACLLKIAADEIAEMALQIDEQLIAAEAQKISASVYDSVQTSAWKENFFARCLINDSRDGGYTYLGSKGDRLSLDPAVDGSYYLNSYSWSLLAGIASDEQISTMLDVIDEYLKTPAGLKLCTLVNYDLLGVETGTSYYFPGDRENGGVFKHAAMMATVASLKAAKQVTSETLASRLYHLADFMIQKTLPYTCMENPYILKGNPRFCTQYNNSETCENIGPILSGTASWLTLAVYEVLGIEIEQNTIAFHPVINENSVMDYTVTLNETPVSVHIDGSKHFRFTSESIVMLDGIPCSARFTLPQDHQSHSVTVIL